ncbi:EAL domain-containing protein [Lysinibacillus capsici]|uniref:EAL domain-containing protein n=1 Tax=Lysinibacillus capsici TaxID=2115968 RepID=UPI0024816FAC|nr:EAL domain-containing protein [Lysinibacillus capsici]
MTFAPTQFEINRNAAINSINSKTSFTLIYVKIKRSRWHEEEQNNNGLNTLEEAFNAQCSYVEYYRVFEDEIVIIIVNPLKTQEITKELKLISNLDVQLLRVENRNLPALHYLRQVSQLKGTNNTIHNNLLKYGLNIEEFSTVFQPILHKSKQLSFEALARWTSKDLGVISPTVFIPILESEGLLNILTKKIINEAVELLKRYSEIVYITINLTASLVKDITWLLEHLESLDFQDNRRIAFELTEESLAGIEVKENLKRIRKRGHLLFIDDFGTGYSNFQYLATLEFDGVKLDRIFMGDQTNKKVIILLSKFIKALDLKFIIEGVERYEQFSFLLETKYDAIQGYYISHPLSKNDLINFIDDMRFD